MLPKMWWAAVTKSCCCEERLGLAFHPKHVKNPNKQSRSLLARLWSPLAAVVLWMAALVICTHRLGAQSLWLDEGYAAAYVTESFLSRLVGDLFVPTQAYPAYHLLLKATTRLLGDAEWALRLPSAIAGSLAVPAMYALGVELRGRWVGGLAALLLAGSPFAIWQAQDAKAYSLTLLMTIVLWWTFARALRLGSRTAWRWFALAAVIAPFVHRLLVLVLLGCVAVWSLEAPRRSQRWQRWAVGGVGLAVLAMAGGLAWALARQGAAGQFSAAGPVSALLITFARFAVDRGPSDLAPAVWAIWGGLTLLGVATWLWLLRAPDAAERRTARVVLLLGGIPLLVFLLLFAVQPAYEPRYLVIIYPAWLLLLAGGGDGTLMGRIGPQTRMGGRLFVGAGVALALVWGYRSLHEPNKGLFSGAVVKEDFRGVVGELARRVHPDDLVVVQPEAAAALYRYYARRVAQPLPLALSFSPGERRNGFADFERRVIGETLASRDRAWLVIAPSHANVVDAPPVAGDEVGWIGLAFQYGNENGRIQCINPSPTRFNGVWLYCNNIPDHAGRTPQPAVVAVADFMANLRLRGVTITPFDGGLRRGGTLPVTLFWQPLRSLADTDYQVFLHLTRPDDPTVLAQTDGRPMEGGQPTSRWTKPNVLLHDERTIAIPADLAPGRYVVRVGLYQFANNAVERLTVGNTVLPTTDNSVVVAEVEIK